MCEQISFVILALKHGVDLSTQEIAVVAFGLPFSVAWMLLGRTVVMLYQLFSTISLIVSRCLWSSEYEKVAFSNSRWNCAKTKGIWKQQCSLNKFQAL